MLKSTSFAPLAACTLICLGCASQPAPEATAQHVTPPRAAAIPSQISIMIQDYKFIPSKISASPGQKIHLSIRNTGHEEHGMEFDLPTGVVALPSHVRPGETGELDLTAPAQPGTYHFHCPVGNHYARGMEGDIEVR